MAVDADVPLLVCVLAGNPVTSTTVLACLNTADATRLRRLHPAVAGVVADVPWADTDTPVADVVRWRAVLPAAVGARLAPSVERDLLTKKAAAVALGGVTHLDLRDGWNVTDKLLLRLPPSLRALKIRKCDGLTGDGSFTHLVALVSLDCGVGPIFDDSLQKLEGTWVVRGLPDGVSLEHLRQLRVLRADWSNLGDETLASLPPSLEELAVSHCSSLTRDASFEHLTALRSLDVANCGISPTH